MSVDLPVELLEVYGRLELCVCSLLIGLFNDCFWMAIGHPAGFWHAQVRAKTPKTL